MAILYHYLCWLMMATMNHALCPYQECQCDLPYIECFDNGFNGVPHLNKSIQGFTSLTFNRNKMTRIPAGSLPANLTYIYIYNNPLATIDDTAFDESVLTLLYLTISNLRLTRIPDAFSHLRSLQELYIYECSIEDWNEEAMKTIGSTVETLDIENVDFSSSPPTWLQYFSRLNQLTIMNCVLQSLPDNAMHLMSNSLTLLNFYNNSLTEVPKAFSSVKSLVTLYLSTNRISNTVWLPSSSKLIDLSLDGNLIFNTTQLSNSLRPYANTLQSFYIQINRLTSLPQLSFLAHIQSLSFENNKLSDFNSGSLPGNLSYLDLNNNSLTRIPPVISSLNYITDISLNYNSVRSIQETDFPPSAEYVYLGFNLITEITQNSFPERNVIQGIYLNNNPISRITSSAFTRLQKLSYLSLQGTKITRLPLGLSSLTNLYGLDLTDIPGLVCTCMEKSLQVWVSELKTYTLSGTCGDTSIYEFFTTLSPGCPTQ